MAIDTEPHRRRRDAERNHERILAAASDCFAEVGGEAQMADIARRAGVGVGTVYRAFSTKEALAVAIATSCLSKVADAARDATTDDDAWRGFSGFVEHVITAADGARPFSGLVKQSVADTELAEALAEVGHAVRDLTEHAQAAGVVRADLPAADHRREPQGHGRGGPQRGLGLKCLRRRRPRPHLPRRPAAARSLGVLGDEGRDGLREVLRR